MDIGQANSHCTFQREDGLLFMPSLKVAMFIWGLCCAIDNIGWLVVYHKNREKFLEI